MSDTFWFIASVDATRPNPHRTRTWMFLASEAEAVQLALKNGQLFCDGGHYTHLLIESAKCGQVFNFLRKEIWFRFNGDIVPPTPCDKPLEFKNVVSFTIG